MTTIRTLFVAAACSLLLAACGGGGDTAESALAAAPAPAPTTTPTAAPNVEDSEESSPNHTVMTLTGDLTFTHDGPGGKCERTQVPSMDINGTSYRFSGTDDSGATFSFQILEYESDGKVDSVLLNTTLSNGDERSFIMNATQGPDGTISVDPEAKGAQFNLTLKGFTHDGTVHVAGSITCP